MSDRVVRAMTDDGAFRVIALRSTSTVQGIVEAQQLSGRAATQLCEIVTSSVLVRETMAPGNRVQVICRDGAGNQLVGDAHPDGKTRGLARIHDAVLGLDLDDRCLLQVVRVMRGGRQHEGIVETRESSGLATALMHYFLQSEQIMSTVALGCRVDGDRVADAGGYVIQLLPEVTEPPLQRLTRQLETLGDLAAHVVATGADPDLMLEAVLAGFAHTRLADASVEFACPCDELRAMGAVAALGEAEIRELLATGQELPVKCDYCRTEYRIGPPHFRRILGEDEASGA